MKRARTMPILASTVALISVADSFSSSVQPGIEAFRIAGSLSACPHPRARLGDADLSGHFHALIIPKR